LRLEIALGDIRLKPLHEVFNLEFLTHVLGCSASKFLRRDKDVRNDLNYTVLSNAILNADAAEAVDLDADETTVAGDVDAEAAVLEKGRQVHVEVSLRHTLLRLVVGLVEGVGVQGVVMDDVVLEQCLQVLLTVSGEEECVDLRAELLEGEVRGSEESAALVIGGVELIEKAGFAETKLKSRELAGQEVDDLNNVGRRDDDGVHTVNHAVGTEDVNGNDAAVEVDSEALETDVEAQTLWERLAAEMVTLEEGGDGVGDENTAGGVEVGYDMVAE